MTESQIQAEIMRAFSTRTDMRLWRANVGAARFKGRVVTFGVPGQADLTGILPGGVRLEIEVKKPGGRQSKQQVAYQRMIERFGGVYVLAQCVGDVWRAIGEQIESQNAVDSSDRTRDRERRVPDTRACTGGDRVGDCRGGTADAEAGAW